MYCKNCGKFLAGNENFCSNCGTKVEEQIVPPINKEVDKLEKETDNIKMISPIDDIIWDLKEFPSNSPRKTEEPDFNWRSDDMFLHKEIKKDKEESEFVGKVTEDEEVVEEIQKRDTIEVPNIFKEFEEMKIPEPEREMAPSVVTRNTAPIETNYSEEENVVEIAQPNGGGVAIEVTESEKGEVVVEKVVLDEPELTSAILDEAETVEIHSEETEEISAEEEAVEENRGEVENTEEPSKTLFDEIAPKAVETLEGAKLNEEKKQIDKFYTFNRKKEEFQKLLDREYERIERKCEPGGFEEDIAGFMDVERGTDVEGTSQIEEMVRARELFFDNPFYVPEEEGIPVDELQVSEEPAEESFEDEAEVSQVVFEPEADTSLAENLIEEAEEEKSTEEPLVEITEEITPVQEEKTEKADDMNPEPAQVIIDPSENKKEDDAESLAKEFFEEDEDMPKRGKGSTVAMWTLGIIIVLIAVLLAIRVILPDTIVSRTMDHIAAKGVTFVTGLFGDEDKSQPQEERESLVEDKSGLIQLQIDKNYKENIGKISYNKDAKYDPAKTYTLDKLKDVKDIQTNKWYEDSDGTVHYYDEELVGTIIAFESQSNALVNHKDTKVYELMEKGCPLESKVKPTAGKGGEKFESLEIGDIKVAANAYYVWVIETKNGKSVPKVYEIKETDKKLKLTDVSEA